MINIYISNLVEEVNDFVSDVFVVSFFVVYDIGGGGEDNVVELMGRE